MTNFIDLGLPSQLVAALERMKITSPTPIQTAAIPPALSGIDILASAQTGTGKTVAYSIPLIVKLSEGEKGTALILTPTRELAVQVQNTLHQILGSAFSFKTVLLIGGTSMSNQIKGLKRHPQLIIGTPGRINDHLERGTLALHETKFLIIDEADRMMDMGFGVQLDRIAEYLPDARQTLMFSATFPSNIERLSQKYLKEPKRISIGSSSIPAPKIKQEILQVSSEEKKTQLVKQLDQRGGSIIVFVKTRRGADRLSKELNQSGYATAAIHGDLPQRRRDRVIQAFRSGKSRILVATDVAARGLDIPHVMHVINYDLPQCPEDYIHRIGRTGRAGAEGSALCLISPADRDLWRAICKLLNPGSVPQMQGSPSQGSSSRGSPQKAKPARGRFQHKRRFFKKPFKKRFLNHAKRES